MREMYKPINGYEEELLHLMIAMSGQSLRVGSEQGSNAILITQMLNN